MKITLERIAAFLSLKPRLSIYEWEASTGTKIWSGEEGIDRTKKLFSFEFMDLIKICRLQIENEEGDNMSKIEFTEANPCLTIHQWEEMSGRTINDNGVLGSKESIIYGETFDQLEAIFQEEPKIPPGGGKVSNCLDIPPPPPPPPPPREITTFGAHPPKTRRIDEKTRRDKDLEPIYGAIRKVTERIAEWREERLQQVIKPRSKWIPHWLWLAIIRTLLEIRGEPLGTKISDKKDGGAIITITFEEKTMVVVRMKPKYIPRWIWNVLMRGMINLKALP